MTLDEFTEKHELTFVVNEMSAGAQEFHGFKFAAKHEGLSRFSNRIGCNLIGAYGLGDTREDAIQEYKNNISEQIIRLPDFAVIKAPCIV